MENVILGEMNKKIIVGIVAVLVVVGGGIFLWQQQGSDSEIKPTKWSQAGDYKITETPEGTIVENKKARFSFKVPEGWEIKDEGDGVEYFLNLLSPDVKFDVDNFLLKGCFVSVEAVFDKDSVSNTKASIQYADKGSNKEVIQIGPYRALQTIIIPSVVSNDPQVLKKVRDVVQIEIPLKEEILINFVLNTKKDSSKGCLNLFNQILSEISFR